MNRLCTLLPSEFLAPGRSLLLAKFSKEGDRLPDGFGFGGEAQEDLLEGVFVEDLAELGVVGGALLEAEEEVDFGAGGRHVGLDEEGLESDEVGDEVDHEGSSRLGKGLLGSLKPELGILQVLIASR